MTGRLYDRLNIFSPFHSPDTAHLFYIEIYVLIRFPMQRLVKRMAKTRKILPLDLVLYWMLFQALYICMRNHSLTRR